jgi:hypothetical protein
MRSSNGATGQEIRMRLFDLKDLKPQHRLLEVVSFLAVLINIVYAAVSYASLPETIPIHFTIKGIADDWAEKKAFIAFPAVSLIFYFLFSYLTRLPEKFNFPSELDYEEKRKLTIGMLRWIKAEVLFLLFYIELTIVRNPEGHADFLYGFPVFAGALTLTLCINFYLGYRIKHRQEKGKSS